MRLPAKVGLLFVLFVISTVSLFAAPRAPLPPWPERTLATWGFDDYYWQSISGIALPLDSSLAESWSGFALDRNAFTTSPAVLPVIDSGKMNIALDSGAIRFWFQSGSTSGKGTGTYARLIELVEFTPKLLETWFSLYLNPDSTAIYFSGQGQAGATDFLEAKVNWQMGQWHLIEINYTAKASALFVDGQPVAEGQGI